MMRARLLRIVAIPALAVAAAGCGDGPGPNPEPELTSVEVTPATTTLFTLAPGNSVTLSAVPQDQNGQPMTGLGPPSFSSGNEAVATVGSDGTVTAVGTGSTQITASVTAGAVTETGTATVTVEDAAATAGVSAPGFVFQPVSANVSAGGTVTWTFGAIHHDVTFTGSGAPPNIPALENGSASRTFPNNGTFPYECMLHPGMTGSVQVH